MSDENGNGTEHAAMQDEIVLTFDAARDRLNIGGHFNSLDRALDILARATRTLELQWRLQQAQAAQQRQVADLRIASLLGGARGRG